MKKKLLILFSFISITALYSCEEVVDIALPESDPRLVIEASLIWKKGSLGNNQTIHLTTTTSFYNSDIPPVEGAQVEVSNASGDIFIFTETEPGIYTTAAFIPQLNETYQLKVMYEGEIYTANETMVSVVDIEEIEQSNSGGLNGNDIELKAYYTDPVAAKNYYLFRFYFDDLSIQIYEDKFTNGNRTFAYFSNEDLKSGNDVGFEIQGISQQFYEYLYILRAQTGDNNGGPFQTQPTIVRGNIVNITNQNNFAFGYFRLSQSQEKTYTIQ
ncbi:DUF4249 domain-containing protein [Gillisia sp. M10.2A]|uniref:DUF4249 domain-containing protein n=1 Tax=Gillisia lutea TaxID=2909668 RepID=A0ABS9EDF8_9FLAO|nr:DUF4249 domain-containing protein [Gillisia lutea]MCF4100900.1 DUF4249 domain-containing protein [Gillisia lutea]